MENQNVSEQDQLKNQEPAVEATAQDMPETFETTGGNEANGLGDELKKMQQELAESKDKYLRLYSEFENFRRRTSKEKIEMIQSANEQLVKNFLPVADDFERAEDALKKADSKELEGFILIYNKFKKVLEQAGVKPMELAKGAEFNTDLHEAITQIPVEDDLLKGKIVDVLEKGYVLNDKVIRFAKVVVGN